ncbi:MAG TPA: PAS domain S-box protein, partial [Pseudomonadales bacterium]
MEGQVGAAILRAPETRHQCAPPYWRAGQQPRFAMSVAREQVQELPPINVSGVPDSTWMTSILRAGEHTPTPELFELMANSVTDYAIFLLDSRGHVASWNPGACRIKGYAAEEIIGQHFSVFYAQNDIA